MNVAKNHTLRGLLPLILVLLIAFGFRMWHLNSESIWHDEAWSIRAIHGPFTTPDDNTPFLYYFSGHVLWRLGGGDSPLALRYISVLIGSLTVAVGLRLARNYGRWSLAFGLMLALSPLLWEYAQEVRAYVGVPLVALLMILGAERLLRHKPGRLVPRGVWFFLFMVELAGLYTHNLSVPLVVWLNAALGVVWLLRRDWRHMFTWAAVQMALILAYIPWILTQSPSGTPLNSPPEPGPDLLREVWLAYFLPALTQFQEAQAGQGGAAGFLPWLDLLGLVLILLILLLALLAFFGRDARLRVWAWLLISHALLVPAFSTALMLAANIDFHPRYYIAAVPGTLLLLLAAVAELETAIRPALFRRGLKLVGGVNVLLLLWLSLASVWQITETRRYQHDDFAGLAAYYDSLPAGTRIIVPFDDEPALQYYFDRVLDIQAEFVNIPLYSDEKTALEMLNGLGESTLEFLTWFQLPADQRGMYPCLLAAASTEAPGAPMTYFGLMTQRYYIVPMQMQPVSADPAYRQADLTDLAYVSSPWGTCVRGVWRLNESLSEDMQLALSILNPFGDEIARSDAPLARPDNAGTSDWQTDEMGQSYNLLILPDAAPEQVYDARMNLYTASVPSGFDLLDVNGAPVGVDYLLAEALLSSGPPWPESVDDPLLLAQSAEQISTGIPFDLTLLLPAASSPSDVPVTLRGTAFELRASLQSEPVPVRGWLRFVVPPGNSGEAVLVVDAAELAGFEIRDLERVFAAPDVDDVLDVRFLGIATLSGIQRDSVTIANDTEPQITLVWQAEGQIERAYTVFVQLISPQGEVIAQSDRMPVNGERPTTSWVEGEYILDPHSLRWNRQDYSGPVSLAIGFYDAADGFRRALTVDGEDAVLLADVLEVVGS